MLGRMLACPSQPVEPENDGYECIDLLDCGTKSSLQSNPTMEDQGISYRVGHAMSKAHPQAENAQWLQRNNALKTREQRKNYGPKFSFETALHRHRKLKKVPPSAKSESTGIWNSMQNQL